MTDFQQKRQLKKIIYSKLTLVVLFIAVIFLVRSNYDIYQKYKLSLSTYNEVKGDYDSLKSRKDMLESEIDRLKTDNGIEEEIRSKFSVAKPGETVVVVVNNGTSTNTDVSNSGFWSNLWGLFK